ncbi:MAG: DNA polymerase III subunit delta [Bacillota bacterium]|nr:DNA polymerase III subunit delta [Bacillota bacterium]
MDYRQVMTRIRNGTVHPLYLFSGPEDYLKEELLRNILNFQEQKGNPLFLERIEGEERSLPDLMEGMRQTTIFPGGKLLWVSNPPYLSTSGKKGTPVVEKKDKKGRQSNVKTGEEELTAFIKENISDTLLIFAVKNVDRRKRLVKIIEEAGLVVEFPLLKGPMLVKWIRDELSFQGKNIEEDAMIELIERSGEDLYLLKMELEKILIFMDKEKVVTCTLIDNLVPESRQGNIFNLVDALGHKDVDEAFQQLAKMRQRNEPSLVIMSMIIRQYRLLYQALVLKEQQNLSQREIAATLKLPPFVAGEILKQLNNYKQEYLARILMHLQAKDLSIKTGRIEADGAIEELVLELTGEIFLS